MSAHVLPGLDSDLSLMTKVAIVEDSATLRQYLVELIGEIGRAHV